MAIRFKCPHCQKPLSVKDHLAGKKAVCPVCKKAIAIPAPVAAPADLEAFAAEALADKPAEKAPEPVSTKTIEFACPICDEELSLSADLAGKKTPCPKCTNIIKVPILEVVKPKDWRSSQKSGPSAALSNLPEQLSDAWGTEQKGRVSRAAMEEAGALPVPKAEPFGVGGWIRRGVWTCVILVAAIWMANFIIRARDANRVTAALDEAKAALPKMEALQQAEYYRVAGEIDVRNLRVYDAQTNFTLARNAVTNAPKDKDKENSATVEQDMMLYKLILVQVDMGGSGDEVLKRGKDTQRLEWKDEDYLRELRQTLDAIRTVEAKASAIRGVACKLIARGQADIAATLASGPANSFPQLKAQLMGLMLARQEDPANFEVPLPDLTKPIDESLPRVAFAEGFAYKKKFGEALKFATAEGPAPGRLEASVGAAAIILADAANKDAAKDAAPFIEAGWKAYEDFVKENKDQDASWLVLELLRLGSRTDAAGKIKGLADKLPPALKPRAQLDIFEAQLANNPTKIMENGSVEAVPDDKQSARAFAWEALARHNVRLGASINSDAVDEPNRPLLHLGIALGELDRKK